MALPLALVSLIIPLFLITYKRQLSTIKTRGDIHHPRAGARARHRRGKCMSYSDNIDYDNYFVDMLIKLKANVDMLIGYKMLCFGTAKSSRECRKPPPGPPMGWG